jgi:hypothetical protein
VIGPNEAALTSNVQWLDLLGTHLAEHLPIDSHGSIHPVIGPGGQW